MLMLNLAYKIHKNYDMYPSNLTCKTHMKNHSIPLSSCFVLKTFLKCATAKHKRLIIYTAS